MPPERLLQLFELREQAQRIECLGNPKELLLLVCRQDAGGQQPLHRRLRLIVGPPDFTALSLFRLELHGGLKTVDVDPQRPVEFSELAIGQQALEAIIANHLPHDLPVLLLHVALIVASSRTPSREGEMLLFTKRQ